MTLLRVVRKSGFATMAGGVLIALFFVLHPDGQEPGTVKTILTTHYAAEHTIGIVAYLFILVGLTGTYAFLAQRAGVIGLLGFILAFLGTALLVGTFMHDGYDLPIQAKLAPTASTLPTGPMNAAIVVAGVTVVLGFILLGIAIIRFAVAPRALGVVLIVGVVITHLPPPPDSPLGITWAVIAGGAVVFGVGLAWLGYEVTKASEI